MSQQIDYSKIPESIIVTGNEHTRDIYIDGVMLSPKASQAVINHSPDGFFWGYGGSAPSQLSLAILLLYIPRDVATRIYMDFKWEYVSRWKTGEDGTFTVEVPIRAFIMEKVEYLAKSNAIYFEE